MDVLKYIVLFQVNSGRWYAYYQLYDSFEEAESFGKEFNWSKKKMYKVIKTTISK